MSLASAWAQDELSALEARGLRRTLEPLSTRQGAHVTVGGEALVNFSSNDYLGLAGDPRLTAAMAACGQDAGVGSGASRLVVGDHLKHVELEGALAELMGAEAVRLFNSGYAANVGVVSALVGPEDAVFSDALNHASLVDGCRLSRAKTLVFPHADVAALAAALAGTKARRKLVVTDAVFSMDGDLAPLAELVRVCELHGAALLVDEAHAVGVLGPSGAGLCELLGLSRRVDVRVGTLGKALGVYGAFAATSRPVADLFVQRARSLVFSTMLPAALSAASLEALRILKTEPSRRARLWTNIERFAEGLRALGVPAKATAAVFPLVLGAPERALEATARLRAKGVLVKAMRPPTVAPGTSRLRFALSTAHSDEDLACVLEGVADVLAAVPRP